MFPCSKPTNIGFVLSTTSTLLK